MKVFKNKILPIMLCAIMLSTQIIFGCLTVRAHADENVVQWFTDNFSDSVSAIGGAIWNSTTECWNAWKRILGLDTDEEVEQYINDNVFLTGHTGGGYDVRFTPQFVDDMQNFVNDYKTEYEDFKYCYSIDFKRWSNAFASRARYQSILNLLNLYPNDVFVFYTYYGVSSDPTSANDNNSIQQGGDRAIRIYRLSNEFASFVLNSDITGFFSVYPYNDDWQKLKYSSSTIYGFAQQGDTNLSVVGLPSYYDETIDFTAVDADKNAYPLGGGNGFWSPAGNTYYVIHSSPHGYPMYRTTDIMKQYSLGNQPYYVVPTNPNITYDNGYYSVTTTQLDNSISYGDISSYVEDNSITEYSTVISYINNYYYNNGGGSGGGSGSGGSGSDIDWGWLGSIGEVIGGLISALGNVIAGIIDAISQLITSITEGLPNVFGQLMEWLFPFLPDYLISLLSLTIMAVVIVSLVKLLRGK